MTDHEAPPCVLNMWHRAGLGHHFDVITEGVPMTTFLTGPAPASPDTPPAHHGQRRAGGKEPARRGERGRARGRERSSSLEVTRRHSSSSDDLFDGFSPLDSPMTPPQTSSGPIEGPVSDWPPTPLSWEPEVGALKGQRQRRGRARERLQRKAPAHGCSLVSSSGSSPSPTLCRTPSSASSHDDAPAPLPSPCGGQLQRHASGTQYEADCEELCSLVYREHACAPQTPPQAIPEGPVRQPRGAHTRSNVTLTDLEASAAAVGSWHSSEPCSPFDLYPEAPVELLMWPPASAGCTGGAPPPARPRQWRSSSLDEYSLSYSADGSNSPSRCCSPEREEPPEWRAEGPNGNGTGWSGSGSSTANASAGGSPHLGEAYPRRSRLHRSGTASPSSASSPSEPGSLRSLRAKPEASPPQFSSLRKLQLRPESSLPAGFKTGLERSASGSPRFATKPQQSPPPTRFGRPTEAPLPAGGDGAGGGAEGEKVELFFFNEEPEAHGSEGAQEPEPKPSALQLKIMARLNAIKKMEQELKVSASHSLHRARDLLLPPHFAAHSSPAETPEHAVELRHAEHAPEQRRAAQILRIRERQASRNLGRVRSPPPRAERQGSGCLQHLDNDSPARTKAAPTEQQASAASDQGCTNTHPAGPASAPATLRSALKSHGSIRSLGKGDLNTKTVSFSDVVHVRRYATAKH